MEKLRILLAEDNQTNILLAKTVLEKLGHSVLVAKNGIEALDILAESDVDIVLMDIEMPEMDGVEAARIIRSGGRGIKRPDVPIIAMTAHAASDIRDISIEAGMNGYITKPVDITKINKVMYKFK
jgi:CheY-like chemotaxis protein